MISLMTKLLSGENVSHGKIPITLLLTTISLFLPAIFNSVGYAPKGEKTPQKL